MKIINKGSYFGKFKIQKEGDFFYLYTMYNGAWNMVQDQFDTEKDAEKTINYLCA